MSPEETRDALWKAILEKVDELRAGHDNHGSMRGEAYYSTNNRSCMCRLSLGRREGGDDVFLITAGAPAFESIHVRVEQFQDAHDEHWMRTLAEMTDQDVFIDGMHYRIGPKNARGMKGFGGRTFHIRLASGAVVTTDNLWAGSRVPPVWRHRIPDNAAFVDAPAT